MLALYKSTEMLGYILTVAGATLTVLAGMFSAWMAARPQPKLVYAQLPESGAGALTASTNERKPAQRLQFETTALSSYYNHALARANISFWFSLTFAAIGFLVIVSAVLTYSADDAFGTVVKAGSGALIDTVAGLFFVQSTASQRAMQEFFEKLRLDRAKAEARDLIGEIEDVSRRDELRMQLVRRYAELDNVA